jgi:hypothetical protein
MQAREDLALKEVLSAGKDRSGPIEKISTLAASAATPRVNCKINDFVELIGVSTYKLAREWRFTVLVPNIALTGL